MGNPQAVRREMSEHWNRDPEYALGLAIIIGGCSLFAFTVGVIVGAVVW
jgi:hypothetical protein